MDDFEIVLEGIEDLKYVGKDCVFFILFLELEMEFMSLLDFESLFLVDNDKFFWLYFWGMGFSF